MRPFWIARSTVEEGSTVAVKQSTVKLMLRREPTIITTSGFQVGNAAAFLGLEKVVIKIPHTATAMGIIWDPAGGQYLSLPIVTWNRSLG